MGALAHAVRQGKALYVGISSYPEQQTREAHRILKEMGVPVILHQPSYSVLNRWIEKDRTIDACGELGIGVIAFSPLSQGVLSGKYSVGCQSRHARGASAGHPAREPCRAARAGGRRPARRDRARQGTDDGAARARLGAAPSRDDLDADRRAHARSTQGEPGRARQSRAEPARRSRRSTTRPRTARSTCIPTPQELAELTGTTSDGGTHETDDHDLSAR